MRQSALETLVKFTRHKINTVASDWRSLCYVDEPISTHWRALPLLNEGTLYGIDINRFSVVTSRLEFHEFLKAYESVVGTVEDGKWIRGKCGQNLAELGTRFGLTPSQANALFPDVDYANPFNVFPALAVLAATNYGGSMQQVGFYDLRARVDNFQFGIWKGKLLSNNFEIPFEPNPEFSRPHVVHGRRREFPETELSIRFGNILHNLNRLAISADDYATVRTSFQLMLGNDSDWMRNTWLVGENIMHREPEAAMSAMDLAKEYHLYSQPVHYLKQQLVPLIMNSVEFTCTFGSAGKVDFDRMVKIDNALIEIKNQLNKERITSCYMD